MQAFQVNRDMLRRALSLQILEPEDLHGLGVDVSDVPGMLKALEAKNLLRPAVSEALARLIELRPADASTSTSDSESGAESGVGLLGSGAPAELAVGRATLELAEEPPPERAPAGPRRPTLEPAEDGALRTGDGGRSTVAPADGKPGTVVRGGTVLREQGRSPKPAPAGGLNVGRETVAPEDEPKGSGEATGGGALNAGKGTQANENDGEVEPADPSSFGLNVSKGTLDHEEPEAGHARLSSNARTIVPEDSSSTVDSAEDWYRITDLTALDAPRRMALEGAAFARIALRLGYATREQVDAAATQTEMRIEDRLAADGAVDPARAMEIFEICQQRRAACAHCFGIMPTAARSCPLCGRAAIAPRKERSGKPRGIEGFPEEGGVFAGYELLQHAADGGMGVVFKARQMKLNRIVALKVLRGGNMATKGRRRRFLQEAEAAASLKHPSIVPVHEIDEVAGYPFYTMDFIEGPSLDRYVKEKKCSPREIAALLRAIADAVRHFHLHGTIHRDLKPDNILVAEDGTPKIIDFGIAKKLGAEKEGGTIEGAVLGTPHYMSPEQAAGRIAEVDTRTDVYALGTILYELLTGAPPWHKLPHAALVVAIQQEDPPAIRSARPDVEVDLEAVCAKAMAKERERRYQSAGELAEDLERYLANRPIHARPASLLYRTQKFVKRRFAVVVSTAIVSATLAAAGGFAYRKSIEAEREALALVARAKETQNLKEAQELVAKALGRDPANVEAVAFKSVVDARLEAIDRQKQLEADRERAQAEVKVQRAAEEERRQDGERRKKRAEELRREAEEKRTVDAARSIQLLVRAEIVLPAGPSDARTAIENRQVDLALELAKGDLEVGEIKGAGRWLDHANSLDAAKSRKADIDAVATALERIKTGKKDVEDARRLAREGSNRERWRQVRSLLERAIERGWRRDDVKKDLEEAQRGLIALAEDELAEGRALLARKDTAGAIARANLAREDDPRSEAIARFMASCQRQMVAEAQREAARISTRDPARALALLDDAARSVHDEALSALLQREVKARGALQASAALADRVAFIPELESFGTKRGTFMGRAEVTNAEFKKFCDAGGYADASLWGVGADVVKTLVDASGRPGPRAWDRGGYGDPKNAGQPVRGVTIHEARAYARWLSKTSGDRWRLPTETEWKVAAAWDPATGELREYPWGADFDVRALACMLDAPSDVSRVARDCSPLGVHDAAGNVMEWVESDVPGQTPRVKGAHFESDAELAQDLARIAQAGTPPATPPKQQLRLVGFRLVLER